MSTPSKINESLLTPEKIRELFNYDAVTGILAWKIKPCSSVRIGDAVGSLGGRGYLTTTFRGKQYGVHRLVFVWVHGHFPKDQIDHINHVRNDNRISNLREVSQSENSKNASLSKRNTSGFLGVGWSKECRKWSANISVDGKLVHLGLFAHKQDAIDARQEARAKNGYHPNHGDERWFNELEMPCAQARFSRG